MGKTSPTLIREREISQRLREQIKGEQIKSHNEIEKLEAEVKKQVGYVEMYRKESTDRLTEITAVHVALDALNVVRKTGTDSWSPDMPISARLFAWMAGAKEVKETE